MPLLPQPPRLRKNQRTARALTAQTLAFLGLSAATAPPTVSEFDRYLSTSATEGVDAMLWWADNNNLSPGVAAIGRLP